MRTVLLLVVVSACAEPMKVVDQPDSGMMTVSASDGGTQVIDVVWAPCPLKTGGSGGAAECAIIATPLDPSNPSGPSIDYWVKRFRPDGGQHRRQLWMLQGGPGASGLVFENLSEAMATRFPDVDYYFPDHRGTGRSSRLTCPAQESVASEAGLYISDAEWPACRAHLASTVGSKLASYSMTNAANDVGVAIEAMRQPGQPVFIYGVSYGSALAHRFLQLFPSRVDGVVLDSIVAPGMSLYRQDEDSNVAARDYFAACSADAVCGAKLGPNAWQKAEALFAKLKTGHCADVALPDLATHIVLRRAFGGMLMDPTLRGYVAAIVYRFDRCDARDLPALRQLMTQLSAVPNPPLEHQLWGWVLSQNVLHSEFAETPLPTRAQLEAIREASVASRDVTTGFEVNLDWPRYSLDRFANTYAETETPMLMLQGGLDPATIIQKARVLRPHFTKPNQTWVELPTATHTTIASSPYVNDVNERRSCGTVMMMSFIENPKRPVDTSCVSRVEGVNWNLPSAMYNQGLFGSASAWE